MLKYLKKSVSVLCASISVLAVNNAYAQEPVKTNKVIVTKNGCEDSLKAKSGAIEGGLIATIGISLADLVLDELFSFAGKYIEKRKKELSATYGATSLVRDGLGTSSGRCVVLISGKFLPVNSKQTQNYSGRVHPSIAQTFYNENYITDVNSIYAYDIETANSSAPKGSGISTFSVSPYAVQFEKSNAKRNKKDFKKVITTLTFETVYKDAKKGVQREERKLVFDHSSINYGATLKEIDMQTLIKGELVDSEILQRPMKIEVSVAETEDESAIDKILASLYESEKENIKSTIRAIWGTEDE